MARKKRKRSGPSLAEQADKYELYQEAVQDPEQEAPFLDRLYRRHKGEEAKVLREDFCGTFALCCEWLRLGPEKRAVGVDLDPEPIAWGRRHNLSDLEPHEQKRLRVLERDVRDVAGPKADLVASQNFSFFGLRTREELKSYFRAARRNLKPGGLFILDMMGGPDTIAGDSEEKRNYDGFTYIWEHRGFDPMTHTATCYIHFAFRDGSSIDRAFTYPWRIWSMPEVTDLLAETGFDAPAAYWEDTDRETGEGNGTFRRRKHGDPDATTWIAYVVAERPASGSRGSSSKGKSGKAR